MGSYQALAFDFGASTGRAVLGTLADGKLTRREVYRFDNTPVERDGTLYWDIDALLAGVREGMARAETFDSLAFDTWGVDFGLLDAEGRLLAPPVHYRDRRTAANLHAAGAKVADERVFHATVGASGAEPETVVAGVLHLTPFKADVLGKVEVHGGGDACRCLFAVFTPLGHHIG